MRAFALLPLALVALPIVPPVEARAQVPYPLCLPENGPRTPVRESATIFFDVIVLDAVVVYGFDCRVPASVGPFSFSVHTTPFSYHGQERTPSSWTPVARDDGNVQNPRPGIDVVHVSLAQGFALAPGTWGIAVHSSGGHYVTPGLINANDPILIVAPGSVASGSFTGAPQASRSWPACLWIHRQFGLLPDFETYDRQGYSPLPVNFLNTTWCSNQSGFVQFAWDFEDDGTVDSFARDPTHVYLLAGIYSVRLTATDPVFGAVSVVKRDFISIDPITARFVPMTRSGRVPLTVRFTDWSEGPITAWAWDFQGDGVVDSTERNPTWVYANPGLYLPTLEVRNRGQVDRTTDEPGVYVMPTSVDPGPPDILQYQFDEPRGAAVANTATSTRYPPFGSVPSPRWQADAGRPGSDPVAPGIGCLGYSLGSPNLVRTGARAVHAGSLTISFKLRRAHESRWWVPDSGFVISDGPFRVRLTSNSVAFAGGGTLGTAEYQGRVWWSLSGTHEWHHYALVIDDTTGTILLWENGVPDRTLRTYPPGTYVYPGSANELVVGATWSGANRVTALNDLDDLRIYGRALGEPEIGGLMLGETAAVSTFGTGCPGGAGTPVIGASGGPPRLGNAAFRIEAGNLEPGALVVLFTGLGATASTLPIDLSAWLGPGCVAELLPDLGAFGVGAGPSFSIPLPLPNDQNLRGVHVYAQAFAFGTRGAASPALDVHLER
ncbi:MAG: PKD domain-containing protein [Planctomycetes bacterium]|nr:PKD domain-containing protein [Planctomycetota bacterium]